MNKIKFTYDKFRTVKFGFSIFFCLVKFAFLPLALLLFPDTIYYIQLYPDDDLFLETKIKKRKRISVC